MKRFSLFISLTCLYFTVLAQHHNPNYVDGKLYLRLKTTDTTFGLNNAAIASLALRYQMDTCYRPFAGLGNDTLDRTYCIKFSDTANTSPCIDSLQALNAIELVEQVPIFHTSFVPNDLNPNQYALILINAEDAWNISKGSTSITVAIVDNAILATHQDLAANMVSGYDVADNDNNTAPPAGFTGIAWNHGTHCSGIASAVTNNDIGIASIGFNTKIMPVKCTSDTSTSGDEIYFADEGITYAIQNGANVISMSFGGYQSSATEAILMNTAYSKGIVLVAAAGNDDSTGISYPAGYNGVISVGATDQNDVKASFSNYGSRIDIMAPGVSIYSTFATSNSAYGTFSGTSMSTPMVAGLAALVLAVNPSYGPSQVLSAIQTGADNINAENPEYVGEIGAGRINAYHALGGVGPGAGIETINGAADISFYPNPFSDKLIVHFDNNITTTILQVLDMQGRTVLQQEITNQATAEIETSQLPAGVYLIKLVSGTGVRSGKIVKM